MIFVFELNLIYIITLLAVIAAEFFFQGKEHYQRVYEKNMTFPVLSILLIEKRGKLCYYKVKCFKEKNHADN